jgi:hypothetical protein
MTFSTLCCVLTGLLAPLLILTTGCAGLLLFGLTKADASLFETPSLDILRCYIIYIYIYIIYMLNLIGYGCQSVRLRWLCHLASILCSWNGIQQLNFPLNLQSALSRSDFASSTGTNGYICRQESYFSSIYFRSLMY